MVGEEAVQRGDALHQPGLEARPFLGVDHAGDQREREDALGAGVVGVDRERHPAIELIEVRRSLSRQVVARAPALQALAEVRVVGADASVAIEHLVWTSQLSVVAEQVIPHRDLRLFCLVYLAAMSRSGSRSVPIMRYGRVSDVGRIASRASIKT